MNTINFEGHFSQLWWLHNLLNAYQRLEQSYQGKKSSDFWELPKQERYQAIWI